MFACLRSLSGLMAETVAAGASDGQASDVEKIAKALQGGTSDFGEDGVDPDILRALLATMTARS